MPRYQPIQNAFSAGELSPRLFGRTDLAKYGSGVATLENWTVQPQGGVTRRPGSIFLAEVKDSTKTTRLIPFVFSPLTSYMLEVGERYIRFYRDAARIEVTGVPVEVATPYAAAELDGLDVRQSADVMYFFHSGYATRKLERYSDTIWRFREVDWAPPPSFEYGARPAGTVTPSWASCEQTITLTGAPVSPATAVFINADVGREVVVTSGVNAGARVTITGFTDATHVTGMITQDFVDTTANPAASWKITASPMTGVTPAAVTPAGKTAVNLTLDANGWRGGVNGFGTDADCGRYALINGGMFEITAVTSATVAVATIRGEANATPTKAESDTWSLEEALWSAINGFPESAAFFEGRLWPIKGSYLAGSKTGDFENFGVGILADDAVIFSMQDVTALKWIIGARALLLGSTSAEHAASGGAGEVITASNIQVNAQTTYGSAGVAPVRVGQTILFLTRSKRKLRELVFQFEVDGYVAPDLLLLAEHLTDDETIEDLAYQQEPNSTIWAVRSDGVALTCAYLREQNVVAWARQTTQGAIESVATVPSVHADEVYWIARRTINGVTRRYVEWVADDIHSQGHYGSVQTDATRIYSGAPATTITGLEHLEGATVAVLGDGAVYPDAVVSGGQITISPGAARVEVGLPYTSTLVTLRPEIPSAAGSSQPAQTRVVYLQARLLETLGLTVNGDAIPFRRAHDPLGEAVPLFTGDKVVTLLDNEQEGRVTIQQTQPLPATVLMLTGVLEVGGA